MNRFIKQVFKQHITYWPLMTTVSALCGHHLSHERHRNRFKQLVANIQLINPQLMIKSTALINENKIIDEINDLLITSIIMVYDVGCYDTEEYPCKISRGTGFAFSKLPFGYILTNYHVIAGSHLVFFEKYQTDHQGHIKGVGVDPDSPQGEVVYADPGLDLALIRIIGDTLPTYLELADEVVMGEPVVMVGNPSGPPYCITDGIVVSVDRRDNSSLGTYKYWTSTQNQDNILLTHNGATYPGFSGAPILNMKGQVVGVHHSSLWGFHGAFGASLSKVRYFIEKALQDKKDNCIYLYNHYKSLGIVVKPYDHKSRKQSVIKMRLRKLGPRALLNKFNGLIVWETFDITSAIDDNHFKRFDVILAVNGNVINSVNDLKNCVNSCRDNEELSVNVMRNFEANDRVLKIQPKSIEMSII